MIRRSALFACFAGALLAGPPAAGQDLAAPAASPPAQDAAPPIPPPPSPPSDQPAPAPAPAQASAPSGQPSSAPTLATPAQGGAPAPVVPAPAPVLAQPLQTLDLFSAGRESGLGVDLWKGSSAAIARDVIPTLGDKPLSPAAAALARSVLSTAATAPDGAGADAQLAAARVRALLALGDAPDVDAILDRTPGLSGDAALSQIAAEAALITDQPDKACRIGDSLSTGRQALYWLRLRAFCQARQGKTPEAQLTFTIAVQEGAGADFARLMGVVLAGAGAPGPASLRDGLDYALSRQLQLDLTSALADAPAAIAEHVRALTSPPAPLTQSQPAHAATASPDAAAATAPSEADVLSVLRAARRPAEYVSAAKAQAGAIAGLVQAKTPLAEPVQLANAALAAGDIASAQAIRATLVQDSIPGVGAGDLAILDAAIAAAANKQDPQTLDRLAERGGAGDPADRARAQAAAAIFAPVAGTVSPGARAALAGFDLGAPGGRAGVVLSLELAADAGIKGDAALLSLSLAQAAGAAGPAPADRARLEQALWRAGLAASARAFAVEGLIALQSR